MIKGQISFDLILVMIVAVVFVGSIALVVGVIGDNAKIDSIRSQERQIGNEIAEVLNSATVLKGGDSFSVSYDIPEIRTADPADSSNCNISIGTNDITITYTDSELVVTQTSVPFAIESGVISYPQTLQCGQTMGVTP